ncbi:helix-turn-helix domain-containing protein [Streptomyces lannensis]
MKHAQGSAYERLRVAAAQWKVPAAVREVATAPPSDPEPNQVWRAVWEHTVQLVLITGVDDTTVQVIPVSLERYADAHTLLLPAEASTLEQPLALWWGLRHSLPWCVLDRQVSELTVPLPTSLHPERPQQATSGGQWGTAVPSPGTAVAEYRGLVTDHLARLSAARWEPEGTGALPQLLQQQGIDARQLAKHLQLSPPQALSVRRGQTPITPEQAQRLAEVLGTSADDLLTANPALPPAVLLEMNRPLRRWQVRTLATRQGDTENQVRRRAAFEICTLAARQEDRNDVYWAARADRYFELHLG